MYSEYLLRKIRRRKIIIALAVVFIILLFATNALFSNNSSAIKSGPLEDVSCYYATEGDALPEIDEPFFLATNSVLFHETSCSSRLSSRQTCVIEAAARTHADWHIHVIFSGPINKLTLGDINFELLKLMKNVYFWRVHIVDYAKGTPLEELVSSGALSRTLWPVSYTRDVLSYLTLYKYGGVYLDLDMLVAKPLGKLGKNWAVREKDLFVQSSAMAFDRDTVGTLVADAAVRRLATNGVSWGYNTRSVITDVLKDVCSTDIVNEMTADQCLGFEVYPPEIVYKLHGRWFDFSRQPRTEPTLDEDVFFYQIRNLDSSTDKESFNVELPKRYCPIVYETYRHRFGI